MINPSPYMFYLNFGETQIVGSSPEVLIRVENNEIMERPIAGTRRRGKDMDEDLLLTEELLNNAKEKAEHIMLVDLARNDIGRMAIPSTESVKELMKIEKFSHVMHMVSMVTGKLKSEHDIFDVFRATFPAGTVTGAPKIRAMEIIEELEEERRGPYAGSIGYFAFDNTMDQAINIRSILFSNDTYTIQAGAGILADSDPEKEYEEITNKAKALFGAMELTKEL
jgi:anthranilate synthase component 1